MHWTFEKHPRTIRGGIGRTGDLISSTAIGNQSTAESLLVKALLSQKQSLLSKLGSAIRARKRACELGGRKALTAVASGAAPVRSSVSSRVAEVTV
jgi:hypothetical protein